MEKDELELTVEVGDKVLVLDIDVDNEFDSVLEIVRLAVEVGVNVIDCDPDGVTETEGESAGLLVSE